MSITIEQLVSREVIYCVSHLVGEITKTSGELQEQAFELHQSQPDYEEAAISAGFDKYEFEGETVWAWLDGEKLEDVTHYETAKEVCEAVELDVYNYCPEILEHWIVSDWLADKLIEKGETVDKDFAGLTIWGRQTSGQGISQDYVIQQIFEELIK